MRVLLLSSNADDKKFFEGAAKAAGHDFAPMASAEQICTELQQDSGALTVVDVSTADLFKQFESTVAEKIGLFSAAVNPNYLFFVAPVTLHDCPYLIQSDLFGHFVERTFSDADQALIGRVMAQAVTERAFGFEKYLGKDAKTQTIKVTQTIQKKAIVESFKNYLVKIGFKARIATVIATAMDELIMNAIFDAPVDEIGKHIHAQTPRNAAFTLDEKNVVEAKIGFDGQTLAISVADLHGSLDKKKLLAQHLGKSYETNQYESKPMSAGAGLGLSQVYRNCGGIVMACEGGVRTEVSLFFKKTDSFKDFKDQFRFLSTFMYF